MEFQVSARKWRPQKFSELIGQEHIVRTLKNAIELDRIAHAYLFSGTRGVGKTTSARLLAKALNCEKGPTPEPCDTCTHCIEIRDGHSVDVLEIDGASNNGVAEVRDLIDNVQYSTSACRFKVYIIDEVHMLSKNAFNALLKTLEEPPERVVFIFATTELTKIPETILSRCQCFEFKPLLHKQIMQQLDLICKNDQIEIDTGSLEEVAKNGAGSMRDAQSLLDQVIAFCGRKVDPGAVKDVLGIVGHDQLADFIDQVVAQDGAGLIETVHQVSQDGKDLQLFCRDLIEYIRHLMIAKVTAKPEQLLDQPPEMVKRLTSQAAGLHADQLQQMFQALLQAEMLMKRSSLPRSVFEMAVVRLLDARPYQNVDALINQINTMQGEPAAAPSPVASAPVQSMPASPARPAPAAAQQSAAREEPAPRVEAPKPGNASGYWEQIRTQAAEAKRAFDHYLAQAQVLQLNEDLLHLAVPDPFTQDQLAKEENAALLKDIAQQVMGTSHIQLKLECRPTSGQAAPDSNEDTEDSPPPSSLKKSTGGPSEDKILKEALDIFGGNVIR